MAQAVRGTEEQKIFLVSYMERNPAFCQREFRGAQGLLELRQKWNLLSEMLNNVPNGARKTPDQWQRFWNDQRKAVKSRAAQINQFLGRGTGGGSPMLLMTSYERRVLACMGGFTRVVGFTQVVDPLEVDPMAFNIPVHNAPLQNVHAPLPHAPLQGGPVQIAPVQNHPLQIAPLQHAPISYAPIPYAPLQGAPVQIAPVQYNPCQHAPLQHAPLQHAPLQHAPENAPQYQQGPNAMNAFEDSIAEGIPPAELDVQPEIGREMDMQWVLDPSAVPSNTVGENYTPDLLFPSIPASLPQAAQSATSVTSSISTLTSVGTAAQLNAVYKTAQSMPTCSRAASQPTFMRIQPPVAQSAASTAVRAATQPTSKVSSLTPARTDLTPKQTAKFMQPQPSCSKATPQPTFMRIQASVAQSATSTAVSASTQPRIPISVVRLTAQPTATVSTLTPVRTALQNTPRQTVQVMQPQPSCSRATATPKSKFSAKPAAKIPSALSVVRSTAQPSSMRIQPPVAQLPTSTPERATAQPTFVRIQSGPSTPIRTLPVPIPPAPVKVSTPSAPAVSLPSTTPLRPMKRLLPLEPLPAKVQKSYENRTVRSNPATPVPKVVDGLKFIIIRRPPLGEIQNKQPPLGG